MGGITEHMQLVHEQLAEHLCLPSSMVWLATGGTSRSQSMQGQTRHYQAAALAAAHVPDRQGMDKVVCHGRHTADISSELNTMTTDADTIKTRLRYKW